MKKVLLFISILMSILSNGQKLGNLKGKIISQSTKQPVAGATISFVNLKRSTVADSTGVFMLQNVGVGVYPLQVSGLGFQLKRISEVEIQQGKTAYLEIELLDDIGSGKLNEVILKSSRLTFKGENNPLTPVSTFSFSREEIFRSPGAQGDIFRAIGILPGVISSGAQYSAIAVRGQGTTDNVYMVDDIPMFQLSHLEIEGFSGGFNDPNGGRFSVFAPRIIDNAQFQGGGFSSQFGRKSSSYLGLSIKEGNKETKAFSGQFDLLGFTMIGEGGLSKKTSIFGSARYQNFTAIGPIVKIPVADPPQFADIVVKTTTIINAKNKFSILAMVNPEKAGRTVGDVEYTGNVNDLNSTPVIGHSDVTNGVVGFNLRTLTSSNSYLKNILYYRFSQVNNSIGYAYPFVDADGNIQNKENVYIEPDLRHIKNDQSEFGFRSIFSKKINNVISVTTGVDLASVKLDYSRVLLHKDTIYTYNSTDFRPDPSKYFLEVNPSDFNSNFNKTATNASAYIDLSLTLFKRLTLNPSLRYDYTDFAENKSYFSPRLNGSVKLNNTQTLNFASGIFYQDPNQVNIVGQPEGHQLKSERTIQYILGYRNQFTPDLKFVFEGWYKQFDDLTVQPTSGHSFLTSDGTGHAFGGDISLVKRLTKKFYGQIGYSYMESKRNDNDGLGDYDFIFSRPNVVSLLGSYKYSNKWIFSSKFRYSTGGPTNKYVVHNNIFNNTNYLRYSGEIEKKNQNRLVDFYSWDIRADYKVPVRKANFTAFVDIVDAFDYSNQNSGFFQPQTGQTYYLGLAIFPTFGVKIEW